MKHKLVRLIFSFAVLFCLASPALAQGEYPLTLSLSKDFGYSGFGIDIQGVFSLKVKGPEDLARVIFMIDDQPMSEVDAPPFRYQFDTGNYPMGKHTLRAVGYSASGQELGSNVLTREFVSSGQGFQGAMNIVLPVLGLIVVAAAIAWGLPALLLGRKKKVLPPGAARSYAPLGGTVCPKCGRPFSIHIYGLNMVVGKLDRCPYCGKWSVVSRASPDTLRAAEAAELEAELLASPVNKETDAAEDLRKDLDNSRYLEG